MTVSALRQQIRDWCAARAEEQLRLLCEIAAIPSPSLHEERRAAFLLAWLRGRGLQGAYTDKAKNVLLPLGCEGRNDITVLAAHTDVVFPDTEPLPVRTDDARIYAPGVGDDTANVTALLLYAEFLRDHPPAVPLLLVWNSCEEGLGNLRGSRAVCDAFAGRIKAFVSFDGQYTSLVNRAVGSERWRVTARTAGGHSYAAFGAPNAIAEAAGLIAALYRQEVPAADGRKTTFNVGTISGGTSVNSIAQDAEFTYEYRSDDRAALEQMRSRFLSMVEARQDGRVRWEAELIGERPCGEAADAEAERRLLDRCGRAVESVAGTFPGFRASSTDCNIPFSRGIPATAFGLYLGARSHTREEYVERASLQTGLEIGLALLADLAGISRI